MGDRRPSLFSRLLASTAPPARRAPAAQTPARPRVATTDTPPTPSPSISAPAAQTPARPRAVTTDKPPSPSLANAPSIIQSTTATTPPIVEPKTPTRRPIATTASDTSIPSISPNPNNSRLSNAVDAKAPPPSNEQQKVDQPTYATPSRSVEEPKKVLPSSTSTQSRSPPLPSSPSRATPQARSTPPSPSTPPKASPLRSPSNVASRSPKTTPSPATTAPQTKSSSRESLTKSRSFKGTDFPSSSKEPQRLTQEINKSNQESTFDSNPKDPKSVESLERLLAENDGKNKPNIEQKRNLDVKKEVQELVLLKNGDSSNPHEKKANDFLTQKSGHEAQTIEKAEIPRTRNHTHINYESPSETKEILSTSPLNKNPINAKTHETPNKRITNSNPGDHLSLHNDIKNGLSKFSNQMSIPDLKSDNNPSVITLAGENRGAVMQIGSNASQRDGPIHIHRGYKLNSEPVTTDMDQESVERNKFYDAKGTESDQDQPPETAYVNNNSQGLNNSIVLSSSVSERDPGVHIVITKETIRPAGPVETRKVEYNTSSANKLTYSKPVVKRRCLRGMLLESSDSDPEKPRRHGCRVAVKEDVGVKEGFHVLDRGTVQGLINEFKIAGKEPPAADDEVAAEAELVASAADPYVAPMDI